MKKEIRFFIDEEMHSALKRAAKEKSLPLGSYARMLAIERFRQISSQSGLNKTMDLEFTV